MATKPILLSGVKPTGHIHIGNLIGALKQWVKLQYQYQSYFPIVDLHSITVKHDPKELHDLTLQVAKLYIAIGIDTKKSVLFIQSHVSCHAELTWILNCISKVSELKRMTQYKDAIAKGKVATVGLFDYPILMAADILLYQTNLVPIGDDQKQHLELAQKIAKRFNHRYGNTFTVPKEYIIKEGARIMSLTNPKEKMSKSDANGLNAIGLLDPPEQIRKAIKKAVTDSGTEIIYRDDKPALQNLLTIYSSLTNIPIKKLEKKYQGKGYKKFKQDLAEVVVNVLEQIQERYAALKDREVLEILKKGAKTATTVAQKTLKDVKKKLGFIS